MKAKTPRATDEQSRRRVEELLRIRLDGAELYDIREYVREKAEAKDPVWGDNLLSDSQLYRLLRKADSQITRACQEERSKLLRLHLAKRRSLYARAVNVGDLRAALAALRDEAVLLDLYPRPEDELRKEVDALKKQLAELEHGDGNLAGGHRLRSTDDRGADRAGGGPAGPDPAGPGAADDECGDDARHVAGGAAALPVAEDAVALFPPGGEEPDRCRARA